MSKPSSKSRKTRTCSSLSDCRVTKPPSHLPRPCSLKSASAWAKPCLKASTAPLSRPTRARSRSPPEPPAPPAPSTASQASVESVLDSSQARSSITSPEATAPPAAPESSTTATDTPTHQGQLIVDATVVEQAIRFPTDLSLLNEAREFSEKIIDALCKDLNVNPKPRTYRRKARSAYLAVAKQKRPVAKVLRRGLKQQLQYLRRNLGHIERLLAPIPHGSPLPLPRWLLYRYWVIQHLYQQQRHMHQSHTRRCDHRIVSISQPYVRPIVRGKLNKAVEFGAKLSVSLTGDGLAHVDQLRWEAFHEGQDLVTQVDAYRTRYGHYPEKVLADPLYGTRSNRDYLKQRGIHFAGKPLGRPKQNTEDNRAQLKQAKAQRRQDYLRRIPIEGKFGQGKRSYQLNDIRAKRANTAFAWINSIFLVMNLLILERIFFAPRKSCLAALMTAVKFAWQRGGLNPGDFLRPTNRIACWAS